VLCAKSYKIKKNWPTAAVAAAAVSRSTAGGHRAASPVIGSSTPSLACYRKPVAAEVGLPRISTGWGEAAATVGLYRKMSTSDQPLGLWSFALAVT